MEKLLELVNSQPNNIEARMELARKYLNNGNQEEARALLEEVIGINPKHLDANYILGQIYEFDEEFQKAAECFERIVEQQPTYDFIYKLGQLYEGIDDYEKALQMFNACYQNNPKDSNICERMAHVCRILGRRDDAIELYKQLLVLNNDDIVALTQLMELYEEEGNKFLYYITRARINELEEVLSQAISSYKKAVNEAPDNSESLKVRVAIVNLLLKKENYSQAVDEILAILELDSRNYRAYVSLAEAYVKLDNPGAACEAYEKALEIHPSEKDILNELADLYFEIEEPENALKTLENLEKLDPNNLSHKVNLAKAHIPLGNDTKAEELLNAVLNKDSKNIEAIGVLTDYYLLRKNYEQAIVNAEKIKKLVPKSPFGYRKSGEVYEATGKIFESHYNFGHYHDLKGEKQLAIDEFNWALEHDPKNLEITLKLARLYEETSEEYIAVEYYQRAYRIDRENITALQKMGEIYTGKKDYDMAIEVFNSIIKLNENNKDAYFIVAELYEQVKDYNKAYENYNAYLKLAGLSAKSDEAKARIDKLESRINGEEDEGFLNKIMRIFSR